MTVIDSDINYDELLEQAHDLIENIENRDDEKIKETMAAMVSEQESEVYQEIGVLTRELHDALGDVRSDSIISSLDEGAMVDVRERLSFVIEKTEESANRTLSAIENSTPFCDELEEITQHVNEQWEKFISRELSAGEFRTLTKEISGTFLRYSEVTEKIRGNMNDILMAQDFQDITGQVIRRVIDIVKDVEDGLVNVIKLSQEKGLKPSAQSVQKETSLEGPQIPGMESKTAVCNQDEVDDLLSSLGF